MVDDLFPLREALYPVVRDLVRGVQPLRPEENPHGPWLTINPRDWTFVHRARKESLPIVRVLVDQIVSVLRRYPKMVANAPGCMHDGGFALVQATDPEGEALAHYIVLPFIQECVDTALRSEWDDAFFDRLFAEAFETLSRADDEVVPRRVVTPVLALDLEKTLRLDDSIELRRIRQDEYRTWADEPFEHSMLRDLLHAQMLVDVPYGSRWDSGQPRRRGIQVVDPFDSFGFREALDAGMQAIAVLRIATGRALPILFSENRIDSIPWVRSQRIHHRPQLADVERRFAVEFSWSVPICAVPLTASEEARVRELWAAATRGGDAIGAVLRLFNHERDFITLYKVMEVVEGDVGASINNWSSKKERSRFDRTANSPSVLGEVWARHGRVGQDPPSAPMTLPEADELIRRIVRGWLLDSGRLTDR